MTNNIISFEEFRLKKKKAESENDPIMQVLKRDLREQEELVDWYLFNRSFNKYKLFLHSLFYNNHERLKGSNPNTGFIQIFNEKQIESIVGRTKDALEWLGRNFIIVECKDKGIREIGRQLPFDKCNNYNDFYKLIQYALLKTDYVLVFKELSKSKVTINKSEIARSIIKINDDAHFKSIFPQSDILFIDYASFLEKSWEDLGPYIEILPSGWG
ncbi:MAG: hypothetical protein R6V54_14795 [Desulfobacteraceae bacterium]